MINFSLSTSSAALFTQRYFKVRILLLSLKYFTPNQSSCFLSQGKKGAQCLCQRTKDFVACLFLSSPDRERAPEQKLKWSFSQFSSSLYATDVYSTLNMSVCILSNKTNRTSSQLSSFHLDQYHRERRYQKSTLFLLPFTPFPITFPLSRKTVIAFHFHVAKHTWWPWKKANCSKHTYTFTYLC